MRPNVAETIAVRRGLVDDAVYPDEAVVRLASIMDEIDADWQQ